MDWACDDRQRTEYPKKWAGCMASCPFLNDNLSILIQTGFFHESAVNGADEALKALCVGNIHDCTLGLYLWMKKLLVCFNS